MNRVQCRLLDECVEADRKGKVEFSEWECEFIESMEDKSIDYELSDKQNATLNRLNMKAQRGY